MDKDEMEINGMKKDWFEGGGGDKNKERMRIGQERGACMQY